jgi:hypothetical protein
MKWRYIVGIAILFLTVVRFAYEKPKLSVDRCSARLMLLRGGYRSWGVDYCYGFQIRNDGSEKHFYHWPRFTHADVRQMFRTSQDWTVSQGETNTVLADPGVIISTNDTDTPYLFDTTAKKEFRPHTYYVSITLPGRGTCVIFKTRPVAHLGKEKPDRIDGICGIGATVWFEDEWQEMTNKLGSKNNILGLTNYLDTIAQQMIDLTPAQK